MGIRQNKLKNFLVGSSQRSQYLHAIAVVVLIAIIGTILLTGSHAANPYAAVNVETGTKTGVATKQPCTGSTDGSCVQFGTQSSGSNSMIVGLNGGGWGPNGITDQLKATNYIRIDEAGGQYAAADVSNISADGGKSIIDFSTDSNGKYNTGGVEAINAAAWSNSALTWYKSACPVASKCPVIEILNEPSGDWFWGNGSNSQSNALAYANLVKTAYLTFHNATTGLGSNSPLITASYDNSSWAGWWWSSAMSQYVDGIIVHPYGGNGDPNTSKLGDRSLVTTAHTFTGKPVYITEVGWPTAVGHPATGDSLQWPESSTTPGSTAGDQCNNAYNFISWARSTNYVSAVMLFGYRDYDSKDSNGNITGYMWYGIERYGQNNGTVDGSSKPVFAALHNQSLGLGNPCPNPVSY